MELKDFQQEVLDRYWARTIPETEKCTIYSVISLALAPYMVCGNSGSPVPPALDELGIPFL